MCGETYQNVAHVDGHSALGFAVLFLLLLLSLTGLAPRALVRRLAILFAFAHFRSRLF
jgi:hypothetical protein